MVKRTLGGDVGGEEWAVVGSRIRLYEPPMLK